MLGFAHNSTGASRHKEQLYGFKTEKPRQGAGMSRMKITGGAG